MLMENEVVVDWQRDDCTRECKICNRPLGPSGLPVIYLDELCSDTDSSQQGHKLFLGRSVVLAFTGYRGQGKSLSLAHTIAMALSQGIKVWSNMPVKFELFENSPFGWKSRICESQPLDMGALYALDSGFQGGAVAIDELQYFLDSRQSMSRSNRLLNAVINQIRKRSLDFYYSIKDLSWADKRDVFETDAEIKCTDANWLNQKVPPGVTILQTCIDRNGWSGIELYNGQAEVQRRKLSHAKRIWPIYNSYQVIDYMDQINRASKDYSEKGQAKESAENKLAELLYSLKNNGAKEASADMIIESLKADGVDMTPKQLGKIFTSYGGERHRTRKGTMYDLEKLVFKENKANV